MSLILDALNRAEHDRKNKNTVPDINTVHTPVSPTVAQPVAKPTAKFVMILIAMSLVAIAIILAVWLFRSSSSSPAAPAPLSQAAVTPQAVATSQAATSQTVATSRAASETSTPIKTQPLAVTPPASVSAPTQTMPPETATTQAVAPAIDNLYAEKSADAVVPDASVEKLYEPEIVEPISESVVTPFEPAGQDSVADAGTGQLITGPTKPQRRYEEIEVQEFNNLAWNQKQQIPTISYSRHNYLPQNVSTVVINGETLGEGNAFSGGSFVVDEIFVDGVVLSFRGNKFKLRALSGWVNM